MHVAVEFLRNFWNVDNAKKSRFWRNLDWIIDFKREKKREKASLGKSFAAVFFLYISFEVGKKNVYLQKTTAKFEKQAENKMIKGAYILVCVQTFLWIHYKSWGGGFLQKNCFSSDFSIISSEMFLDTGAYARSLRKWKRSSIRLLSTALALKSSVTSSQTSLRFRWRHGTLWPGILPVRGRL